MGRETKEREAVWLPEHARKKEEKKVFRVQSEIQCHISGQTYTQTETETVTEREDGGGRCSEF